MTQRNARPSIVRGSSCAGPVFLALLLTLLSSCRESPPSKRSGEPLTAKTVKTAQVEIKPMERTVVVTGSFHAREQSTLSVKVPGRLEKIAVDIGSVVRKGGELAQIERSDYELRVKQAEAVLGQARAVVGLASEGDDDKVDIEQTGTIRQAKALLEEARRNRDRVKQLTVDRIAPQSELDTVEAAHTVAVTRYQDALETIRGRAALVVQRRAELNLARKQLEDSTTYSPFDGIVHQRLANVGEYLQAGTPLLIIAGVNPLRLRLEVPERLSTAIRPGQRARVTVGGSSNIVSAEIARVSPILIQANRMLLVEADVPAASPLRPGLFAQADIIVNENDPALCVPVEAVTSFVGIEKVFLVRDGKAQEKNITTGRRNASFVEVMSGLAAGDVVVLNPGRLRSEQPVVEEANAAAR